MVVNSSKHLWLSLQKNLLRVLWEECDLYSLYWWPLVLVTELKWKKTWQWQPWQTHWTSCNYSRQMLIFVDATHTLLNNMQILLHKHSTCRLDVNYSCTAASCMSGRDISQTRSSACITRKSVVHVWRVLAGLHRLQRLVVHRVQTADIRHSFTTQTALWCVTMNKFRKQRRQFHQR